MNRNNRHLQPKNKQTKTPKPYVPLTSIYEQLKPLVIPPPTLPINLSSDYLSILEMMTAEEITLALKNKPINTSEARVLFERLQPHQRRALLEERALHEFSQNTPSSTTSDSGLPGRNGWFIAVTRAPYPFPLSTPLSFTIGGSSTNTYTNKLLTLNAHPSSYPSIYGSNTAPRAGLNYDFNTSTWTMTGFTGGVNSPIPSFLWRSSVADYNNGSPLPSTILYPAAGVTYPLSSIPANYTYFTNNFTDYINLRTTTVPASATPPITEYVIQDNNLFLNRYASFINTVTSATITTPTYGYTTDINLDYFSNLQTCQITSSQLSALKLNNASIKTLTITGTIPLLDVNINAPSLTNLSIPPSYRLNINYIPTLTSINISTVYDITGYKNLVTNTDNTNLSSGSFNCTLDLNGYNWYDGSLSANFQSLYSKNWSFGSTALSAYQEPQTYTPSRSTYNKLIVLSPGAYNTTGTFLSGEYTRTSTVINNLDTWANSNNSHISYNSTARVWQLTNPGTTGTVYLSTVVTNSTLINNPPTRGWSGLAYNSNTVTGGANYWAETQIIPMDNLQFNSYSYVSNGANPIYRFNPTTSSGNNPLSSYRFPGYNFSALGRNAGRAIDWSRLLMISPIHFIYASHFGVPNGTVYNFSRNNGTLTTGTVLTTRSAVFGDVGLGLLTAPLTGIDPFRTISQNTYNLFKPAGTKLITINQRAQVFDVLTTLIPTINTTQLSLIQSSVIQQLLTSYEQNNNMSSVNNDDSSSPFLLPYTNGELLLVAYAMFAGSPTSGPTIFTPSCVAAINAAMASLEADNGFTFGYTLSTV